MRAHRGHDRGGRSSACTASSSPGCPRAAGSSRRARATPSRRSRSTDCCAAAGWAPEAHRPVPSLEPGRLRPGPLNGRDDHRVTRLSTAPRPAGADPAPRAASPWSSRRARRARARQRPDGSPDASQAPLTPAVARREPDRPPGLAVHADLPGCCSSGSCSSTRSRGSSRRRQHRLRDHPADGPAAGRGDPALPAPARLDPRQMQLLQPEIKELQRKYKGDRVKAAGRGAGVLQGSAAINPAGGCLPILLSSGLLIPMYSVIQPGPHELRPERDVARVRDRPVPEHRVPDRTRVQRGRAT